MNEYDFKTEKKPKNLNAIMLNFFMISDLYHKNRSAIESVSDIELILNLIFESFFERDKGKESLFFAHLYKLGYNEIRLCVGITEILNNYNPNSERGKKFLQETGIKVQSFDFKETVNYAFTKIIAGGIDSFKEEECIIPPLSDLDL